MAAAALAGCGSSSKSDKGVGPSSYINNERVERAIERSVREQRHRPVVVSCPAFVKIKKGGTFKCIASPQRGHAYFRVTMTDDKGSVHYETTPR